MSIIQCVTMPLINASVILSSSDSLEKIRGITEIVEVECRPRKHCYEVKSKGKGAAPETRSAPPFWPVATIPFQSPYSEGVSCIHY